MHDGKEFFFRVEIYSISWLMLRNFEYPLLVYPLGRSDLDTMHTSKHKKKEFLTHPSFEAQCQSDTENEFVSTKSQPEWVSYAVARLTGRSWNRRVQIVKVRGSGRHRADKDEGSPFELTNVELEDQVRR